MRRIRHALLMVLVPGAVIAASVSGAVGASVAQAYGSGAVHQVEISANAQPNLFGPGTGGGIWLWIELDGSQSGGTGDYTGSDCLHRTPIGPTGAVADSGDVQWTSNGTTITITGVVIGGDTAVTITVPESGHLSTDNLSSVFSAPVGGIPGTAQVQVAP
jgi:hypothetical protein